MSQHESPDHPPASAALATETPSAEDLAPPTEPEAEPEPEPEPMTPERVAEWNRYYDFYVAAIVVVLLFVAAAHRVTESRIWVQLKSGELIAKAGRPIVTDPFSFSVKGKPWVNVAWLFDLANAGVYKVGQLVTPTKAGDGAIVNKGGVAAIIGVNALIMAAAGVFLLKLRRPGPGLWWTAVCVGLALGAMIVPTRGDLEQVFVLGMGGIAGSPQLGPQTWGVLLLAIEILLLNRITDRRVEPSSPKPTPPSGSWLPYVLPALFLVWANLDESFLLGLIFAAAWLLGDSFRPARGSAPALAPSRALIVVAACALVCLLNPSFHQVYAAAVDSLVRPLFNRANLLREDLSFFGSASLDYLRGRHKESRGLVVFYPIYYLVVVAVGALSFVINRRHFSLGRFLTFVIAALFWAMFMRLSPIFAVVFAATVALNGQEWYQRRYGTEGRMGRGWTLWSEGGRALTILVLVAALFKGLSGYGSAPQEPVFGFSANVDEFPFEAAEYLRNPKIEGNVLNCDTNEGDALIWTAYPDRRTYVDHRKHVFPPELRKELTAILTALRDDRPEDWRPILDRYNVNVVMLDPRLYARTHDSMSKSQDWIPFYDDGNTVLFGRADAPAADLAYFKDNRLDADQQVFHKMVRSVPFVDRPPTKTSWLDQYLRGRTLVSTQPHVYAGFRWLGIRVGSEPQIIGDPANAFAAIREARIALKSNPDDPSAFRLLSMAYKLLMSEEMAILSRSTSAPPNGYVTFRLRQQATAINFAIMTTPPPTDLESRMALADYQMELALLYRRFGYYDLERDALQAARKLVPASSFPEEELTRLSQLDTVIDRVQAELTEFTGEQQAGPVQRAEFLISRNMLELGIRELEEAEAQGVGLSRVKSRLLDLYCLTGRPDKAVEQLGNLSVDDPALSTGPGTSPYRHGLMNLLVGNYANAATEWDRALLQLRGSESVDALESVRMVLHGEPRSAATSLQELPGRVRNQADWEFEIGLCLLESGNPELAATHFTKSAELNPNLPARGLVAYYLDRLGKPLPPVDRSTAAAPVDGKDDKAQSAEPAKDKDESAKPPEKDAQGPK
jgi:tetratricopeptide (TPR) repeat protein